MPSTTRSASSRWFRLHGIVPVHVDATPTIGLPRRAGSMPIARKCARAGARVAPVASSSRACRRAASCTSAGRVDRAEHELLVDLAGEAADADCADAGLAVEHCDAAEEERELRIEARPLDRVVAHLLGELARRAGVATRCGVCLPLGVEARI